MRLSLPRPTSRTTTVLAGAACGLAGALLFAAAHAVIIVPIWSAMTWGLFSGALAGAAAGWAMSELTSIVESDRAPGALRDGAVFGAALWVLVAPVTLGDALMRAAGLDARYELVAVGVALLLATGTGAAAGWHRTRTKRGAVAGLAATLLLTVAMAGPVPVARSARAVQIFLVVLPIAAVAGAALGVTAHRLRRVTGRSIVSPSPT